jgi:hypothetical protein
MDSQSPPVFHLTGELAPPPPPPPPPAPPAGLAPAVAVAVAVRRHLPRGAALVMPVALGAAVVGILLGGRAAAEDGRSAAATALATGDAARAVSLDEAVAGRSGFLMLLDPGAAAAAARDAQRSRIAWAHQLASAGNVDSAIAALTQVSQPSLIAEASRARAQILIDAAATAIKGGHAALALRRLDQAAQGPPPSSLVGLIATMRSSDEVKAAAELVTIDRAADAVALLDDASAHGGAAAAATAYPATLLAAGQAEIDAQDYADAATTLQRLVTDFGASAQGRVARSLLNAPLAVSGTLVDGAGHGAAGRVRLSTHFTQLSPGYVTSGPFYYGTADSDGDFTISSVPVGGPYVLEYFRDGNWMTLVDPRTDQPANPVTVSPLVPEDLTFIVLP